MFRFPSSKCHSGCWVGAGVNSGNRLGAGSHKKWWFQFNSVAQLCLTLCNPMDCSTPVFPELHHLPELAQTHVHWVSDAIQSSHLLSPPSPAFNRSQHQGLFQWVSSSHQVAKVFIWRSSFGISPSNEYLGLISLRIDWFDLLAIQGTLKESSPTSQFKSINSSALSLLYGPPLTSIHDFWKTIALTLWTFVRNVSAF